MTDPLTLHRLFERGRTVGSGRFVRCFDAQGQLQEQSYRDFADAVEKLALALQARGLKSGQRVATLAANGIRHLQLMWAVPLAGGVFHAINTRLAIDDIGYVLDDADDRFLFVDPGNAQLLDSLWKNRSNLEVFVLGAHDIGGAMSFETLVDSAVPAEPDIAQVVTDENAPAVLCHTSGTTGRPKGVVYSHRALTLHAFNEAMVDGYGINSADRVLLMVPFFHGAGWGVPYSAFMCGADISLLEGSMRPERILEILSNEEITFTGAVPEVIAQIASKIVSSGVKLSNLRILMGGTAPKVEILVSLRKTGISCMLCWGMTETLSAASIQHLPAGDEPCPATQGQPLPLTEFSLSAGQNIERELLVRGPCTVERYFGNDSSARESGWFATGDMATIDSDGTLHIRGRKKDLIKSGGEWICPAEVEEVIAIIPGIKDCAVIGIPHPKWGERPLCVVSTIDRIEKDKIIQLLAESGRFAKWQLPDDIVVLDILPTTNLRKLDRQKLRDIFREHYSNCQDSPPVSRG